MIFFLNKVRQCIVQHINLLLMYLAYWIGYCRKAQTVPLSEAKKILVVRMDGIGDVVMTTPFIRELRRNCPEAHITLIADRVVFSLMRDCPYINELIPFNCTTKFRPQQIVLFGRMLKLARRLRAGCYEWVLMPRWDFETKGGGYAALFSAAPQRVAYDDSLTPMKQLHNNGYNRFYTTILHDDHIHEIDRNLSMLRKLGLSVNTGQVELWIGNHERESTINKFDLSAPGKVKIAVCPGAARPEKIWPIDRFVEVLRQLKELNPNILCVVLGGGQERGLGEAIEKQLGAVFVRNLAGDTSLKETACILAESSACLGNDTGALHIAAALGVPQVMVCCFPLNGQPDALNSPLRFGPRNQTEIIQPKESISPCINGCQKSFAHCILQIESDEVSHAMKETLGTLCLSGK